MNKPEAQFAKVTYNYIFLQVIPVDLSSVSDAIPARSTLRE